MNQILIFISDAALERFKKEAKRLAEFEHPNIVRVLHFFEGSCYFEGKEFETGYLVMEYCEGWSLTEYV